MGFLFELSAGKQQQAAYNYNSDINERNAQVAEQQAEQLVFQEEQNIVDFRKQFDDLQAATSQAFRYNGWIANEGTPLKVALANAQEADEEIATRRYNAKVGRAELKEQGTQERMQGTLNRMYGKAARTASKARAVNSLIQTASAFASV
jgi:hypothetical protein